MRGAGQHRGRQGGWLRLAVLLGAGLGVLGGCNKSEPKDEPKALQKPPPMTVEEVTRGREACNAYLERLCRCAEATPSFADACHMKRAKISALEMLVEMDKTEKSTAAELWKSQETARKIIAACIQENNALDTQGCAR